MRRRSVITLTSGKSQAKSDLINTVFIVSVKNFSHSLAHTKIHRVRHDSGNTSVAYSINAKQYDLNSCNVNPVLDKRNYFPMKYTV